MYPGPSPGPGPPLRGKALPKSRAPNSVSGAPYINTPAGELLRSHVPQCADQRACKGTPREAHLEGRPFPRGPTEVGGTPPKGEGRSNVHPRCGAPGAVPPPIRTPDRLATAQRPARPC